MTVPGTIEVELKYQVADLAIGERLLAAEQLGGFAPVGEIRIAEQTDTYLDTPDGILEAERIGVRLRAEDGATTLTVKAPGSVDGAVRRREELEGPAEAGIPPASWPASAARDRLLALIGDKPLHELVTIRQYRRKRDFATSEATVELSLDEARIVVDGHTVERFTELEAELTRGPESALGPLLGLLDGRPGLSPTVESKLARAIAVATSVRAAVAAVESAGKGPRATAAIQAPAGLPIEPEAAGPAEPEAVGPVEPVAAPAVEPEAAPAVEPEAARPVELLADEPSLGTELVAEPESSALDLEPEDPSEPRADSEPDDEAAEIAEVALDEVEAEEIEAEEIEFGDVGEADELLPILDLPRASDDPLEPPDLAVEPASPAGKSDRVAGGDLDARLPTLKNPGVAAEDLHAEAGRKVLRFHLARMLAREPGTRDGADPEELHGMRVATRRMRAAWRVFGDAYEPARTKSFRRRLRELATLLGGVRDLDVLIEATEAYGEAIGSTDRAGLRPLLAAWRTDRDLARVQLIVELDSRGHRRFVDDYVDFVSSPGRDALPVEPTIPHRVRDTAASRIWTAYEHVRGYEAVLRWADVPTLHQLRIAAKRLRYTLEFVREPLGEDASPLIARVVALQDHLGFMNDAEVAASMARIFLVEHGAELNEAEAQAIGRYLVSREREVARLKRTVGTAWRGVAGLTFRRSLGRTVAIL
jgi:CHAD domain-containing protein